MNTLDINEDELKIETVHCDEDFITVTLKDGRIISNPLSWYPRLLNASPEERSNWRILPFGNAIHWEGIDEDLSIKGMLCGIKTSHTTSEFISENV